MQLVTSRILGWFASAFQNGHGQHRRAILLNIHNEFALAFAFRFDESILH
jgi:hypothetical protein